MPIFGSARENHCVAFVISQKVSRDPVEPWVDRESLPLFTFIRAEITALPVPTWFIVLRCFFGIRFVHLFPGVFVEIGRPGCQGFPQTEERPSFLRLS